MIASIKALLRRDLRFALRDGAGLGTALGFAVIVTTMLPLGVGADPTLLSRIAPGVVWVAVLLSALLSVPRVFDGDNQDGSLAVLQTAPVPFELVVLVKIVAHWLTTALPLVAATPLLGLLLAAPPSTLLPLTTAMVLGTPAVSAIGAVGAALTLATRSSGLLVAVLVLPLFVPILVFGVSAGDTASPVESAHAAQLILAAISLAALALAPFAAAAALRARPPA